MTAMTDPAALLRLAAQLRIAHHIPGRVRLKLNVAGGADLSEIIRAARSLGGSFSQAPGIRSVNVNPAALSCVVEYDPARIPPSAWEDLVRGAPSAVADLLTAAA